MATIIGTNFDDRGPFALVGTRVPPSSEFPRTDNFVDTIFGGLGDDELFGLGGVDNLEGGEGSDDLRGGSGTDVLDGGNGDDLLDGGSAGRGIGRAPSQLRGGHGDDVIRGSSGVDQAFGGDGDDVVDGGAGADFVEGGFGDDVLSGGGGEDRIKGNQGRDSITGGDANDSIAWNSGDESDVVDGGTGVDRQMVQLGPAAESLIVRAPDATPFGAGGAVVLETDQAHLRIEMHGVEALEVRGGDGLDSLRVRDLRGTDLATPFASLEFFGEEGDDALDGALAATPLIGRGGEGNDVLIGGAEADSLFGEENDDRLVGNEGDDRLEGGSGTDDIRGHFGDDQLLGGEERDIFRYDPREGGADTIFDFELGLDQIVVSGIAEDLIDTEDNDVLNSDDGPVFVDEFVPPPGNDLQIDFGGGNTLTIASVSDLLVGDTGEIVFI